METTHRKSRKLILGVVSAKNTLKTGKIRVETLQKHKLYNKYVKHTKYIVFHDEKDEAQVGDKVYVVETRPLSKTKRHALVRIAERARTEEVAG